MSRGNWMRTVSGGRFYPADPQPEDFNIGDIACGLAHECRYGNQIRGWYDVAQHSVLVASILPPELKFQGLMHDAPEAYIADMTRPNKLELPDYRRLEGRVWAAIAQRFDLPVELDPRVKEADDAVLMAERNHLFPDDKDIWSIKAKPADVVIRNIDYLESEALFLEAFHHLTNGAYL